MSYNGDHRKCFACSYMLLKPDQKLSFSDVLAFLFGSDLHRRNFVECTEATFVDFTRRWIIFISLLAQKLLQLLALPLKSLGSFVERWLNLLSANHHSVVTLLFNYLWGKDATPDPSSPEYLSVVGYMDTRVDLDASIKRGDGRYNASVSVMASKLSYENAACLQTIVKNHWKMELVKCGDFWNDYQGKATTQGFIMLDKSEEKQTYVVAFRGTEPFDADAWNTDIDLSWCHLPGVGKIHAGFMKALGLQKSVVGWPKKIQRDDNNNNHPPEAYYAIRDILKQHVNANNEAKFIVTGHSLGGALAILFPAILSLHDETLLLDRLEGVYTFGQPRVGDHEFAEYMEHKLKHHHIKYYRFVYSNDLVPRLPYDYKNLMFKHFGRCLYFDSNYKCKMVEEEPNKNYFSPWAMMPMMINAAREIIRSFFIGFKYGADYREGWFLRTLRIIGLALPGLPNHLPQDYVNATRLGSLLSYLD
ncbi:hypothetical protein QN277_006413 [Acacia crassicarpa]|uniref:Fungal lipase-type domain-containing protein n=1 Tax=Acacia crassicarpa TaxID=499986 RepID=A0AAE1IU12_9FABA|nr:hypothetical protein QN277_006413 [Acacia crassicarpa]